MKLAVSNFAWDIKNSDKMFNHLKSLNINNIEGVLSKIDIWDNLSITKKVKFDTEYLKKKSFIFDLNILYLTFIKIIRREGIHH